MKKTWLIAGAAAIVVVLAVAVFLLKPASSSKDPKHYVLEAWKSTVAEMEKERAKQRDLNEIFAILNENLTAPSRQSLAFRLDDDSFSFGAPGFRIETETDPARHQAKTGFSVTVAGFPLGGATFYLEDDLFSVEAPLFFKGEYGVRLETLGRDYNASDLSRMSGLTLDEGLSFPLWQEKIELSHMPLWLREAGNQFVGGITVEKKDNREVQVNDRLLDCETFEMRVGLETMKRLVYTLWEGLKEEELFQNYLDSQSVNPGESLTFEELDNLVGSVSDFLAGNMTASLFVSDGKLIRADFSLPFQSSEQGEICVSIRIGGDENLIDALYVEVNVAGYGVIFKTGGQHVPSEGAYTTYQALYGINPYDEEPLTLYLASGWYKSNLTENNISWYIELLPDSDGALELSLSGTLLRGTSQKTLHVDLSQIQFSGPGFTQKLSAVYDLQPLASPDFPPRKPIMLLELSMDGIQALIDEARGNFLGLTSLLGVL